MNTVRFPIPRHSLSHPAWKIGFLFLSIVLISCAHYLTDTHHHSYHAIYRRLYYLPIFVGALWFGLRGGVGAALTCSVLYALHILFQWKIVPTMELEKYLEILLFNVAGAITGILAEKANRQRNLYRQTAEELEQAYGQLENNSARLMLVQKMLRQQEKLSALGELGAVVAHEVMNPLGSIKGAAEILQDEFPAGHEKHGFLDILIKETNRLERTVRSVLRFRTEIQLEQRPCNPNDLLQTTITLAGSDAKQRGVSIRSNLCQGTRTLVLDVDKLHQVFLNLSLNAIQAMPEGGTLSVSSQWTPNTIPDAAHQEEHQEQPGFLVVFADTGTGISEEDLGQIFEPFYTTKPEGTGLGLPIVKKILKAHGGDIHVRSTPGHGARFTVWLPANQNRHDHL